MVNIVRYSSIFLGQQPSPVQVEPESIGRAIGTWAQAEIPALSLIVDPGLEVRSGRAVLGEIPILDIDRALLPVPLKVVNGGGAVKQLFLQRIGNGDIVIGGTLLPHGREEAIPLPLRLFRSSGVYHSTAIGVENAVFGQVRQWIDGNFSYSLKVVVAPDDKGNLPLFRETEKLLTLSGGSRQLVLPYEYYVFNPETEYVVIFSPIGSAKAKRYNQDNFAVLVFGLEGKLISIFSVDKKNLLPKGLRLTKNGMERVIAACKGVNNPNVLFERIAPVVVAHVDIYRANKRPRILGKGWNDLLPTGEKFSANISRHAIDLKNVKMLTKGAQLELVKALKTGDFSSVSDDLGVTNPEAAKRALMESCARLVIKTVNKFITSGLSLTTLVVLGYEGLSEGVESAARLFDLERGVQFGTYVVWHIRAPIMKVLKTSRPNGSFSGVVSLDEPMESNRPNKGRSERTLQEIFAFVGLSGNTPLSAEDALIAQDEERETREAIMLYLFQTSIERPTIFHEYAKYEGQLKTIFEDINADPLIFRPGLRMERDTVLFHGFPRKLISILRRLHRTTLDSQERRVVFERFGIMCDTSGHLILDKHGHIQECREKTLKEIGEGLDLSRQRVHQIESKARRKILIAAYGENG